jgi:hypothetical protein
MLRIVPNHHAYQRLAGFSSLLPPSANVKAGGFP